MDKMYGPIKRGHALILLHVTLALQMRIHSYYWKDSIGSHNSMMDTSSCKNSLELRKTSSYTCLWKNEHLNHKFWGIYTSTQSKSGANPCSMWLLSMRLSKQCCLLYNNFLDEEKSKHVSFGSAKWFSVQHFGRFAKGTTKPNTCCWLD
jgi:hypothetical protein